MTAVMMDGIANMPLVTNTLHSVVSYHSSTSRDNVWTRDLKYPINSVTLLQRHGVTASRFKNVTL